METTLIIKEDGLQKETIDGLQHAFNPYYEQASRLAEGAKSIVIKDVTETGLMTQARKLRLEIKDIRIDVEKKRKELKEESLRKGKAIDGIANVIKYLIVPIEEHLQKQEDFVKEIEKAKVEELKEKRYQELKQFELEEIDIECYDLGSMDEKLYKMTYDMLKNNYEHKKQQELEFEKRRIEEEKKETEARERIAVENVKLKKEAEAREKEIQLEREKAEKEKAVIQAKLKKEAEAREKIQLEIENKRQQELKVKAEIEKAEKAKSLLPDKHKLNELAINIVKIEMPDVQADGAKGIIKEVINKLNDISSYIKKESYNLET